MLIKGITKKGDAVPLTAQEALPYAINIALSQGNTTDWVYWLETKSVKVLQFSENNKGNNKGYDAFSEGTFKLGKTRAKDDRFFTPKEHTYKIHFESSKDEIGAPHVKVVSFNMEIKSTNPAKNIGKVEVDNTPVARMSVGELTPDASEQAETPEQQTEEPKQEQKPQGGRVSTQKPKFK
jgi:hypothetical protein